MVGDGGCVGADVAIVNEGASGVGLLGRSVGAGEFVLMAAMAASLGCTAVGGEAVGVGGVFGAGARMATGMIPACPVGAASSSSAAKAAAGLGGGSNGSGFRSQA